MVIFAICSTFAQGLKPGSDKEHKRNFYFGFEQSELLQNRYKNLGIDNFTFFVGQRFRSDKWEKFGWRFLIINAELSEEHLGTNMFIDGPKDGLTGNLTIVRLYLDYYPFELKKGFFKFMPIVSTGLGYNSDGFARNNKSVYRKALAIPFSASLSYTFFNVIFFEFPVVDFTFQTRMKKTYLNDTYINFPEYFSIYMWINLGLKIRF